MKRTLTNVFDDIGEWSNAHGTFYSVTGMFDDGSILQANKKERHTAQELRETLLQILDIECDFYCDDKGLSQNGNQKWKLKAIVDLEGGAIYGNPPNVGAGVGGEVRASRRLPGSTGLRSGVGIPAPAPTSSDKDAEIRGEALFKAAAIFTQGQGWLDFEAAFWNMDELLKRYKSSGPVQSSAGPPPLGQPSQGTPAGPGSTSAGPDTSVGEVDGPAGTTSEGAGDGEAPAPSGTKWNPDEPPPGW